MAVTHLALDLGAGRQSGDRVDDDDVNGTGADEGVRDIEGLLAGDVYKRQMSSRLRTTTWKPSCRTSVKLCISGKSSAASWRA